jgi:glycosyltransferase involved in cell wall biosynthesis
MSVEKELRYVLITPARNEEKYIRFTIESVINQTQPPIRWIIVSDASIDGTDRIVEEYRRKWEWIDLIRMPEHGDRSFSAKARCLNRGYKLLQHLDFDVIGNLDADVSFEADYMQFLMSMFAEIASLGVAGTVFREDGYDSARDSFEGENHVAGGCQLFRRQCFEDVGGYVPNHAGGVDWIAVTTARMKGWTTRSFREKSFFHYRSLGSAGKSRFAAQFSYGEKDYYLGNHPLWELLRIVYRFGKRPLFAAGGALAAGYLWAAVRRIPRPVSPELMKFHRREELRKLHFLVSTILHLNKVDSFSLTSKKSTSS